MADELMFSAEDLRVDSGLGYPKAYAKLCRDRGFGPYSLGPPFTFTPYILQAHQASRAKELDELFPIIDLKAKPSAKPKIFVTILWKQLNHLGNAGFDPETFRVDPYGNVLYFHADSASPLAWEIDHWFPCSRGGLTVSNNLRLLQWQVCKKKHNKLEFLVPWWDLQVGISVNQFLCIFASSNSDFRHRGFSLLFSNGESEELNDAQTVDSHCFPQPFNDSKKNSGLAPAAIVVSRRESNDALLTLQSIDINRKHMANSPIAGRKSRPSMSKENENPYQAIVIARDSLRQREETVKKQAEIEKLAEEVMEMKQKNEAERTAIQDLELMLIKKRRRAEKCRRLAEAQSSYRAMLEKMIRDAMHQSVVYKEQVRLNQAASNALMARLETQKAMCDSSERELHKKFKHRDELEKQIRPEWETRKRSRNDNILCEGNDDKIVLYEEPPAESKIDVPLLQEKDENTLLCLPEINSGHKELRVFLEEEHKVSEAELEDREEQKELQGITYNVRFPVDDELVEEDEESRKQRGKGNVEKWLQILLEEEGTDQNADVDISKTDEIIRKMNLKYPQKEILKYPEQKNAQKEILKNPEQKNAQKEILKIPEQKNVISEKEENLKYAQKEILKIPEEKNKEEPTKTIMKNAPPYKIDSRKSNVGESRRSFEVKERSEKSGKFKEIARSESARMLRRIPSSPSIILGMKKGVDCIRGKPKVIDDDGDEDYAGSRSFMKSSFKVIKKAVKM